MTHDIDKLQTLVQRLAGSAAGIQELSDVLPPIMRTKGWTTVIEYAFVEATLTALQGQVEGVRAQYSRLIDIARQIGHGTPGA